MNTQAIMAMNMAEFAEYRDATAPAEILAVVAEMRVESATMRKEADKLIFGNDAEQGSAMLKQAKKIEARASLLYTDARARAEGW